MKPAMRGCHYATLRVATTPQDWVECAVFATVKVLQAAKSSQVIPHRRMGVPLKIAGWFLDGKMPSING